MIKLIQKRKYYYAVSGIFIVLSILFLIAWGLKPSIDFTGGSLVEVQFKNRPEQTQINEALKNVSFDGGLTIQPAGENAYILRFKNSDDKTHQDILAGLKENFNKDGNEVIENRYESIGPSIGAELAKKTTYAVIIVLLGIIIYVGWAFRKVSYPVASWKYGVVAIIALLHDIIIPLGVFSILGRYFGMEVGLAFVAALLTILGFSVNDTIVVFDRIRENLFKNKKDSFDEIVNISVNQTMTRSINTTGTVIVSLIAIYFFGGESIKYFALALIIGISSGAYSSIFVASPLLVDWEKLARKLKK